MQQEILWSDTFTTTQKSVEVRGDAASRRPDRMYKFLYGDHVFLLTAHRHQHPPWSAKVLIIFPSWHLCLCLLCLWPNPLGDLLCSPMGSIGHYIEFLLSGWQDLLRRLRSLRQPIRIISGDYLKFSVCLKAASLTDKRAVSVCSACENRNEQMKLVSKLVWTEVW